MRLTLSLAAALLLVGAGCSANTNLDTSNETVPNNAAGTVETGSNVVVGADDTPTTSTNSDTATGATVTVSSTVTTPTAKACTMDAKACPDGSFVGRTGPNCEFAACPTKPAEQKPVEKPVEKPTETGPKTYTMAEVKAQVAAGQCWSVISGRVYDLSNWIEKHPGGAGAIKSLCGIDGTAKFTAMHGGDTKAESRLTTFQVGILK